LNLQSGDVEVHLGEEGESAPHGKRRWLIHSGGERRAPGSAMRRA